MISKLPYKRAIITGASSGIGAEIALQLCQAGVIVYAVARTKSKLQEVQKQLSKTQQKRFIVLAKDLQSATDIEEILHETTSNGPIDLLVNNAGVGFSKRFEELSPHEIETMIATNLIGPVRLTHGILKKHDQAQPLQIVFVTSLAGKVGFGELSVYSATKFALEGIGEALRMEYTNTPISITVLRPGITDTAFFHKAGMSDFKRSVEGTKSFYSAQQVATEFLGKITACPPAIVVGNDKYFLKLLPFIPFRHRFKILNIVNKI
ncbi:MAG TPA: SDR family NAD(P)-dependent oxidoreductase [Candidatus Saccharimonadales bacterium]|nr:SDR family NAD(P)-dependent oxidoreductase [Candidatus Saccharimonadales bacterium]